MQLGINNLRLCKRSIEAKNEVAEVMGHYEVIEWEVLGRLKGRLVTSDGAMVSKGSRLKNGENIFFYEAEEVGKHQIRIKIKDEYGETEKELIFWPILVENTPFSDFDISLKADSKELYIHQSKALQLSIASEDPKAKDITFTVKQLILEDGSLHFEDGNEVQIGSKVLFGKQELVFKPSKTASVTKIKLIISNGRKDESADIVLRVKPISFKVTAWMKSSEEKEKEADYGVMEVSLSKVDTELVTEDFKLVEWKFSDGVIREILDKNFKKPLDFPLYVEKSNKFYIKVLPKKLDEGINLKLKIEGPGHHIEEATIDFSSFYEENLASKEKGVLEEIKTQAKEVKETLNLKVDPVNYDKVNSQKQELSEQILGFQDMLAKLEESGLKKEKLERVKKEIKGFEDQIVKINTLSQEIKKRKYAFDLSLKSAKAHVFIHQVGKLSLSISARDEEAKKLVYTIQTIEVEKGTLYFESGQEVQVGSKLAFGKQELIFKTSGEMGNASIKLTAIHDQEAEASSNLVLEIKPIEFRVEAWLKEPKETKSKQGDYGILEVAFADLDKELVKESFKLTGWKFKTDEQDEEMEEFANSEDFETFTKNLHMLIEGGKDETRIAKALENLKAAKVSINKYNEVAVLYKQTLEVGLRKNQQKLLSGNEEVKKITDNAAVAGTLALAFEKKQKERSYEAEEKKLGPVVQQYKTETSLQAARIHRGQQQKTIQYEELEAKEKKLLAQKGMKVVIKDRKQADFKKPVEATLLGSKMEKQTSFDLKGEGLNNFYLNLPQANIRSQLILQVEGPGGVKKEVAVDVRGVLTDNLSKKMKKTLESLEKLTSEVDLQSSLLISGSNYEKLKDFTKAFKTKSKDAFKELEESYGVEWWTNPILMSLKDIEGIADEVISLNKKKEKLYTLKKACKAKKLSFKVSADLKAPEGKKLMGGEYVILKLKLSEVDESLAKEAWKLLSWKCTDDLPRVIVDGKMQELAEFPLSVKQENELYIKFSGVNLGANTKLLLEIGIFGKTTQEVSVELGPIQNSLVGEEISKFSLSVQKLNEEISKYLSAKDVKDKQYERLEDLIVEAELKKQFFEVYDNAFKATFNTSKDVARILPGEPAEALAKLVDKDMPILIKNTETLKAERKEWKAVIESIKKFETEAVVDRIAQASKADAKPRRLGWGVVFSPAEEKKLAEAEKAALDKRVELDWMKNIYTPNENGKLLIHHLAGIAGFPKKEFEFVASKTLNLNATNQGGGDCIADSNR